MGVNELDHEAGVPAAPPTQPFLRPAATKPPGWPSVLGVIAIVLGALGALGGVWGAAAPTVLRAVSRDIPEMESAALDAAEALGAWTIPLAMLTGGLAVLLLVAGIGLVRRRRWSRNAFRAWAVLKIALVATSAVLASFVQQQTFETMQGTDPTAPGMPAAAITVMTVSTVVFTLLWGWALPIFALVWFARRKIGEHVATWV